MAFTDNPTVQAMMQATGLDGQLASSGAAPGSPIGAISSQNTPHSPQMRPEYQSARPPVNPRFAGPQSGGHAPITGVPGTEPGLMDAQTLQSPTVHDLLAHYGVSAPENINDHLFIHDPQAFAKHPMIANMIEQGLGGLANYHTGQDTASTLSNIAQSVIGNQSMHAQAYNNRAMMPFMQAQQVAALQEQVGKQGREEAQQKHDNAMADYYTHLNETRQNIADDKNATTLTVNQGHDQARQAVSPVQAFQNRVAIRLKARGYDSADAAPPEEVMAATKEQQQEDSLGTHAAQVQIGAGHDATSRSNASTRKGAQGRLDQGSAATDKDLVTSLKGAKDQYQFLDNLSKMPPAQRTLAAMDPKNSKYGVGEVTDEAIEARKQQLAQQAGQLHTQRAQLYAKHGMTYTGVQPDAAAPAAAPSGNPFRQ